MNTSLKTLPSEPFSNLGKKLEAGNMGNNNLHLNIKKSLLNLKGRSFWQLWAGGAGSMVSLDTGSKVRIRDARIKRQYEGSVSLFIIGAAWRIDNDNGVVCGSEDPNDKKGPMQKGLRRLVNRKIKKITILNAALDFVIEFEGRFFLRVFCNQTGKSSDLENYCLHLADRIYTVAAKSIVKLEIRNNER